MSPSFRVAWNAFGSGDEAPPDRADEVRDALIFPERMPKYTRIVKIQVAMPAVATGETPGFRACYNGVVLHR